MRPEAGTHSFIASSSKRSDISRLVAVGLIAGIALVSACSSDSPKPSAKSSSSALSATDQLLNEGLQAQKDGRLDVAQQKYSQVTQQDPTNKIAYYDLGVLYQQIKDEAHARSAYEKAIAIDSKYQPALFNLAILETPGNPSRAEDLYRQLLQINPNDGNVHLNLGLLLKQVGRTPEGDTEIQTALGIDPSLASRLPTSESSASSAAN